MTTVPVTEIKRNLRNTADGSRRSRLWNGGQEVGTSQAAHAVKLACKPLLVGSFCWAWLTQAQAQDGQSQAGLHHHPPQDQLLHEKFYSTWHMPDHPLVSCSNDADCYPTEIKYVDGTIYAKRREDGKYIAVPPEKVERNGDNPDGRNHLCAPPPDSPHPNDTVFCFALGGAT
jgi:hypothetical protein